MSAVVIVNAETGEQEQRPMTAAEQQQHDKDAAALAAQEQAEADAEAARIQAERDWRAAVEKATTVDQIKAALLGTNLPAQAETRVR